MFKILVLITVMNGSGSSVTISSYTADGTFISNDSCKEGALVIERIETAHRIKSGLNKVAVTAACYKVDGQ